MRLMRKLFLGMLWLVAMYFAGITLTGCPNMPVGGGGGGEGGGGGGGGGEGNRRVLTEQELRDAEKLLNADPGCVPVGPK